MHTRFRWLGCQYCSKRQCGGHDDPVGGIGVRKIRQPDGFNGNGVAHWHKGEKRQSLAAIKPVTHIHRRSQSASFHQQRYFPGTYAGQSPLASVVALRTRVLPPVAHAKLDSGAPMAYIWFMIIIETPIFTKLVAGILQDDEYRLLQQALVDSPDAGAVIPGSGGLRKLRWSAEGREKRGGSRIIYYWFAGDDVVLRLYIYPKNVQDNLTPSQLRQLEAVVEEEYHGR